jgi:predicted nicotinamide N-methyase
MNSVEHDFMLGKMAIELGSGTGVLGLTAAALGSKVVLTDLPEFGDLIKDNIKENSDLIKSGSGQVEFQPWKWGDFNDTDPNIFGVTLKDIDYILISDCIYYAEGLRDLTVTFMVLSERFEQVENIPGF